MTPDERSLAAGFLLRFFMNRTGATYADVAEGAGVPTVWLTSKDASQAREDRGKHVLNFHNTFQTQYLDQICNYIDEQMESHPLCRNRPSLINDLIEIMRGHFDAAALHQQGAGLDRLFLPALEEGDRWKGRLAKVYGGAWHIIRFAAHVGPGVEVLKNKNDPWMVYAIMNIHKGSDDTGNDLPIFRILYKALRDRENSTRPINGSILSLKEGPYMMFIGVEEGTKWPLILAADQQKDEDARPNSFKSLTLRKFESGSFITGYSMFIRAEKMTWDQLTSHKTLGNVGLFTKSQIVKRLKPQEPEINEIIESLRNTAKNRGRSMLLL
jgi:hypothetical protein